MPFKTLKLQPGVNLINSAFLDALQLTACNLIRFYGGFVEKLGGWLAMCLDDVFVGVCRGLHGWADLLGNAYLAIGTDQRLEVLIGGEIFDITPVIDTENPAVAFSTIINTPDVTILDPVYNPAVGDWVRIATHVAVGGLVLFGYYIVTAVPDGTHFTIQATANATATVVAGGAVATYTTTNTLPTITVTLAAHGLATNSPYMAGVSTTVATVVIFGAYAVTSVTNANQFVITAATIANANTTAPENGGNAQILYLLPSGFAVATAVVGYGIGDYGAGDYGISDNGVQTIFPLRQWSLDHWGQDLIASPSNGKIYFWQPPVIQPAAVLSVTAPLFNSVVLVMPQVQIVVALGSETGGEQEPLLIRWSNAGDFTDWTPTAFNQAGSFLIPTGTKLVGGLAVGLGVLVWTDQDLWSMTYLGLPFVFGFNVVGRACGLISMRARGVAGSLVMWIGLHTMYRYTIGGGVSPMECSVWDFYFDNFDRAQLDQIHCAVNTIWNEMAWHFPIDASSPVYDPAAPMGYIKYNYVENCWDYGQSSQYQRTAWEGHSAAGDPVGADLAGLLQQHEHGRDANGVGMAWSWQTGFFALAEGEEFVFCDLIVPDHSETLGDPTINYTVLVSAYPNRATQTLGPFPANDATEIIPFRARGRQMAIGAAGSDLGTFSRIGALRYRYAPDGRDN